MSVPIQLAVRRDVGTMIKLIVPARLLSRLKVRRCPKSGAEIKVLPRD
jgi:hypothetical protein